jgi:hypothetical protein
VFIVSGFLGSLSWRLLIKLPLGTLSKSKLWLTVFTVLLSLKLPVAELMMQLDMHTYNSSGTGIILVAQKRCLKLYILKRRDKALELILFDNHSTVI